MWCSIGKTIVDYMIWQNDPNCEKNICMPNKLRWFTKFESLCALRFFPKKKIQRNNFIFIGNPDSIDSTKGKVN